MASKTFWKMFNKVVRQCGLSNTFNDWTEETENIKEDINDIQKQVLTISKSYLKKSWVNISWWTVAWQASYAIPATVDKITAVKITSWWVDYYPSEISIFDLHKLSNTNETSDIPVYFSIDKAKLYIYPTPTSNSLPIEINGNIYATDLNTSPSVTTDQNTILEIKEWYENVIYFYALMEAYSRLEDYTSADRYQAKQKEIERKFIEEVRNPTNSIIVWGKKDFIDPNYYNRLT